MLFPQHQLLKFPSCSIIKMREYILLLYELLNMSDRKEICTYYNNHTILLPLKESKEASETQAKQLATLHYTRVAVSYSVIHLIKSTMK